LAEGHRVVAQLKVNYYDRTGSLSWRAQQFRAVGLGALMQQLEQLRQTLAQEGLFRQEYKRPLPLLPLRIGLICGTNSAAQRDVEVNARRQWPSAQFLVRQVTVQGPGAVSEVTTALIELDERDDVDVIVITRGGGSFEDLLPFSNELLLRAVFSAATPIVSAIGHEEDTPLLDLVADVRASTPTAAGKLLVPDQLVEIGTVTDAVTRIRTLVTDRVDRERLVIANLTGRPVMGGPGRILAEQRDLIEARRLRMSRTTTARVLRDRAEVRALTGRPVIARPREWVSPHRAGLAQLHARLTRAAVADLRAARRDVATQSARLTALSPQATLDRGYAVVRDDSQHVVTDPRTLTRGQDLTVRVANGSFAVTVAPDHATDPTQEDQ
jgi:exodeoxyribonuclease VII large subunit